MFRFEADLKVFLHREPIDFRAGINSLVTLVEQSMQLEPFARAVYAFHNRRRNRIKLLLYERNGFWLLLRRLLVRRIHLRARFQTRCARSRAYDRVISHCGCSPHKKSMEGDNIEVLAVQYGERASVPILKRR